MASFQLPDPSSFPPGYLEEVNDGGIKIVAGVFIVLSTIAVVLRLVSRQYKGKTSWGWDDALIIPAYVCLVGLCVLSIIAVKQYYVGRHTAAIIITKGPAGLTPIWKCILALNFLWLPSVTFPKLSVLCLYLRVFGSVRRVEIPCYILIAFVTANFIAFIVVNAVTCIPLNALWDYSIKGKCIDAPAAYVASNAPNIVADIGIMMVPLPTLIRLQMPWSKKVGTLIVFLAGSTGVFGSIYRLVKSANQLTELNPDFAWAIPPGFVWSIVEAGMCFLAACLIAMKPLLERFTQTRLGKAIFGSIARSTRSGGKSNYRNSGVRLDTFASGSKAPHGSHSAPGWTRLEGENYAGAEAHQPLRNHDSLGADKYNDHRGIGVRKDVTVTDTVTDTDSV